MMKQCGVYSYYIIIILFYYFIVFQILGRDDSVYYS